MENKNQRQIIIELRKELKVKDKEISNLKQTLNEIQIRHKEEIDDCNQRRMNIGKETMMRMEARYQELNELYIKHKEESKKMQNELKQQQKLVIDLLDANKQNKEGDEKKDEREEAEFEIILFDSKYKSSRVKLINNNKTAVSPGGDCKCDYILRGGSSVCGGIFVWRVKVTDHLSIYLI